jgi:glyceraldehyde 3-phosphate dehydrogenase
MFKKKNENKKRRIAINGFGRIGRAAFKIATQRDDLEVVAINDLTDPETLAYLLQRDTVYGMYHKKVKASDKKEIKLDDCQGSLDIEGEIYPILSQKEPAKLPWKKLEVDVVIESTGFFVKHEDAKQHLKAGAKKVIISAPAKDDDTPTQVIGVNTKDGVESDIVSNASCTTNCVAPVTAVMHGAFGIKKAFLNTIHSYTSTQSLVDGPHKDLRRGRAAAYNIIPTTTGAAIATTKAIPDLKDKFAGMAVRVPTLAGSIIFSTMLLEKRTTKEEINEAFKKAAKNPYYENVLEVTEEPLVSSDIIGNSHSAIVDLTFTEVVDGDLARVLAWYDNEWGYANRLVEMVKEIKL